METASKEPGRVRPDQDTLALKLDASTHRPETIIFPTQTPSTTLRLTCRLPEKNLRFSLEEGEHEVGATPDCSVCLLHPTISGRHARLFVHGGSVQVEDLGSRNGTFLAGRRISLRETAEPGAMLAFGSISAEIEVIPTGDGIEAFRLGTRPDADAATREPVDRATWAASILEGFCFRSLPSLLARLESGEPQPAIASRVGVAIWESFPCAEIAIGPLSPTGAAPWFRARRDEPTPSNAATHEETDGQVRVAITYWPPSLSAVYVPIAQVALRLIRLAQAPTPPPPRRSTEVPLPEPETLHGELRRIYTQATRLAGGRVSVLIRGESGTGKELLAGYVHRASGRQADQWVALNCAALPRDLLELELFGIEAGVATGVDARPGKFELADEGTLFLDEIGDMALETQAKILRVLQEQTVYRLGAKQPQSARVRIIAATNRDIEDMIRRGTFRSDLYYRIAGWEVELPPLRRRRQDIPNLAAHFLAQEAERLGLGRVGISRSAMDALTAFDWPGNVRELQHEIARGTLLLSDGELLETCHLRPALLEESHGEARTLKETLAQAERRKIEEALDEFQGHLTEAARSLDISRSTLYRRIRALGIDSAAE